MTRPDRRCYYCNALITRANSTRDHIVPKRRMFGLERYALYRAGIKVTRGCCTKCNQLMEMSGECIGVLFCAQAVADHILSNGCSLKYVQSRNRGYTKLVRRILMEWRLMYGANNGAKG